MKVTHEIKIYGICPVDLSLDVYQLEIETMRILPVEDIISAINSLKGPLYQEEMTKNLAEKLKCSIRSIGYHSGFKTTCEV